MRGTDSWCRDGRGSRGNDREGLANRIAARFGDTPMSAITTSDIEDFVAWLKQPTKTSPTHKHERKRRRSTINRYLSMMRHMWNWAREHDIEGVTTTPFRKDGAVVIKLPKEKKAKNCRITHDEERRLLLAANPTLRQIMICAIECGLRLGELRRLTWGDLRTDADGDPYLFVKGVDEVDGDEEVNKDGEDREVPVTPRFMEAVEYFRKDADAKKKRPETVIFSDSTSEPLGHWSKAFENAKARAKVNERITWHWYRHEFAGRLIDRNTPLSQVRDLLGHASIQTTERYDHTTTAARKASVLRRVAS